MKNIVYPDNYLPQGIVAVSFFGLCFYTICLRITNAVVTSHRCFAGVPVKAAVPRSSFRGYEYIVTTFRNARSTLWLIQLIYFGLGMLTSR